jgi:hypothetical protein
LAIFSLPDKSRAAKVRAGEYLARARSCDEQIGHEFSKLELFGTFVKCASIRKAGTVAGKWAK